MSKQHPDDFPSYNNPPPATAEPGPQHPESAPEAPALDKPVANGNGNRVVGDGGPDAELVAAKRCTS